MLVPSFLIQVMSYQKTHRKRQNNSLIEKRIDDLDNAFKVMRHDPMYSCILAQINEIPS